MEIHPVTVERWDDLAELFGPKGAYWNCWCVWWILTGKEFSAARPVERRALLEGLVRSDQEPGLLAYREGKPVGWCAVEPRQRFTRMMSPRSLVFRPLDDPDGNWVVNCFYIAPGERGRGVASELLSAAVRFAFDRGAQSIDGYPLVDATHGAASLYVGTVSMFEAAGFQEIARSKGRPLLRRSR
ncbi:MAG: GNAT family N-acetyltransferase [Acidimicrobiia bacterium]|nr:GNAT family N-acetyltransferase [Acidimicrobiia bacterium]